MEHELDYERIDTFWEWFVLNEERIIAILNEEEHRDKEALVQSLNNQVLQFGPFSWEMGRGRERPYFFTISPNRDPDLFEASQQIVAQAPDLSLWEFNDAKPAQQWDLRLNVFDDDLNEWRINAAPWLFILEQTPKNKVKVLIQAQNMSRLDEDTRASTAELFVTGLAGEALRLRHISGIEVLSDFSPKQKAAAWPMEELRGRIEDLLDLPYE